MKINTSVKTRLIFFSAVLLLARCSDKDDNGFPRKADIEIMINASDSERLSEIETIVYGTNLELRTTSHANTHLPFTKTYLDQELPEPSSVSVSFRDDSMVAMGAAFEPYTIEIIIEIDGEIALSEQHAVNAHGYTVSADLSLTAYFANR